MPLLKVIPTTFTKLANLVFQIFFIIYQFKKTNY